MSDCTDRPPMATIRTLGTAAREAAVSTRAHRRRVGTGTIGNVSGNAIVVPDAQWSNGVSGVHLEITRNGVLIGRYTAWYANPHAVYLSNFPSGAVQPGDHYEGIWVFDELIVRNNA